jgi:hypothetical protein
MLNIVRSNIFGKIFLIVYATFEVSFFHVFMAKKLGLVSSMPF